MLRFFSNSVTELRDDLDKTVKFSLKERIVEHPVHWKTAHLDSASSSYRLLCDKNDSMGKNKNLANRRIIVNSK